MGNEINEDHSRRTIFNRVKRNITWATIFSMILMFAIFIPLGIFLGNWLGLPWWLSLLLLLFCLACGGIGLILGTKTYKRMQK